MGSCRTCGTVVYSECVCGCVVCLIFCGGGGGGERGAAYACRNRYGLIRPLHTPIFRGTERCLQTTKLKG